ncbi:hypothetical protein [Paraburkholderia translucens]|uniref:hypothetical protein n=1 Tax=Paraburkholderia translucens TaxID=2886945 RepID=UPI001E4D6AD9|nr:hypothetical protein [Paraburkholderia sp. MMS20-SJTN17]
MYPRSSREQFPRLVSNFLVRLHFQKGIDIRTKIVASLGEKFVCVGAGGPAVNPVANWKEQMRKAKAKDRMARGMPEAFRPLPTASD